MDDAGGGGPASFEWPLPSAPDTLAADQSANNLTLSHYATMSTSQQQQQQHQHQQIANQLQSKGFEANGLEIDTLSLLAQTIFYSQNSASQTILALLLVLLIFATAVGNVFVIKAICTEKNLRGVGNWLVLSLAIADLLVACLVMTMAGIYLILDRWTMGVFLCDIWTSADVFCCTASILHLLAIALDRYWAVTRVDYIRCQRNKRRIVHMIVFVWLAAAVISLAPAFGWKDAEFEWRITKDQECLLSQDIGYQIFATCTTFYFPLTLTLIFYWKIYQVARKRIRRKPGNRVKIALQQPSSSSSVNSSQQQRHSETNNNNKSPRAQKCHQSIVECSRSGALKSSLLQSGRPGVDSVCPCSCHRNDVSSASRDASVASTNASQLATAAEAKGQGLAGECSRSGSGSGGGPLPIHLADSNRATTIEKTTPTCGTHAPEAAPVRGKRTNDGGGPSTDERSGQIKRLNNLRLDTSKDNPISETGDRKPGTEADNLIYATEAGGDTPTNAQIPPTAGNSRGEEKPGQGGQSSADEGTLEGGERNVGSSGKRTGDNYSNNNGAAGLQNDPRSSKSSLSNCNNNSQAAASAAEPGDSRANCRGCQWSGPLSTPPPLLVNQDKQQASFCSFASCSPGSSLANGFACDEKSATQNYAKGERDDEEDCCDCCCNAAALDIDNNNASRQQQLSSPSHAGNDRAREEPRFISDSSAIPSASQVKLDKSGAPAAELVAPPNSDKTRLDAHSSRSSSRLLPFWRRRGSTLSSVAACWTRLVRNVCGNPHQGTRTLIGDSLSQDDAGGLASVVVVSGDNQNRRNNLPPLTSILSKPRAAKQAQQCKMCHCELIDHHDAINGHTVNSSEQGQAEVTMARAPASAAHIAIKTTVKSPAPTPTALTAAPSASIQRQSSATGSNGGPACNATGNEGLESKRERKAAKTLAIITGVFVMCWLPFFVMAIAMPLLDLKPHKYLFATLQWLGYANSMLNPIIYTIFSPDFRVAFKRMLCGSTWSRNDQRQKEANRFNAAAGGGGGRGARSTINNSTTATNCALASNDTSSRGFNSAATQPLYFHPIIAHFCSACCCCISLPASVLSSSTERDKDRTTSTNSTRDRTLTINNNNHNHNNHLPPNHCATNCALADSDQPEKTQINSSSNSNNSTPRLHGGGITNDF